MHLGVRLESLPDLEEVFGKEVFRERHAVNADPLAHGDEMRRRVKSWEVSALTGQRPRSQIITRLLD